MLLRFDNFRRRAKLFLSEARLQREYPLFMVRNELSWISDRNMADGTGPVPNRRGVALLMLWHGAVRPWIISFRLAFDDGYPRCNEVDF